MCANLSAAPWSTPTVVCCCWHWALLAAKAEEVLVIEALLVVTAPLSSIDVCPEGLIDQGGGGTGTQGEGDRGGLPGAFLRLAA
jgi:hypothetical protein